MADEQEVGVIFPLAGLDVTCEFGRQPQDTTAAAANVRAFETITDRGRGGSRPGLSQYIPEQVSGTAEVQHLDILVDPEQPALSGIMLDGPIVDPSTNNLSTRNLGRYFRSGGSGVVPNRHSTGNQTDPNFRQLGFGNFGEGDDPTVVLDAKPLANSLLLVMITTSGTTEGGAISGPVHIGAADVRNGAGASYAQVSTFADLSYDSGPAPGDNTGYYSLAMYFLVSSGSTNDQTVTLNTPIGPYFVYVDVLEFINVGPVSPNAGSSFSSDGSDVSPWSPGPLALSGGTGDLVVSVFVGFPQQFGPNAGNDIFPLTLTTGGTNRGFGAGPGANSMIIIQNSATMGITFTPILTANTDAMFMAVSGSFHP